MRLLNQIAKQHLNLERVSKGIPIDALGTAEPKPVIVMELVARINSWSANGC